MDGRVRKFVVTSSSVSLVVSFLKELISVMAVLKNVSLKSSLLSFLNNTVAYQSILAAATFCFRCQLWHSVISVFQMPALPATPMISPVAVEVNFQFSSLAMFG